MLSPDPFRVHLIKATPCIFALVPYFLCSTKLGVYFVCLTARPKQSWIYIVFGLRYYNVLPSPNIANFWFVIYEDPNKRCPQKCWATVCCIESFVRCSDFGLRTNLRIVHACCLKVPLARAPHMYPVNAPLKCATIRGSEKGLAGGGCRVGDSQGPKHSKNDSPKFCPLGVQKRGLNLWAREDSSRQPPPSANPFELLTCPVVCSGGHLKKCRSPRPRKVPNKCFGKCQPETGCQGKCRMRCSGSCAPSRTRSTFFSTFLSTPFRAGTFRSTFFGLFFGTSLHGRQNCLRINSRESPRFALEIAGPSKFMMFCCAPLSALCCDRHKAVINPRDTWAQNLCLFAKKPFGTAQSWHSSKSHCESRCVVI